jgi:hypothetical protein
MKTCTKCRVEKPFNAFPFNKKMKDGHDSWCFACRNAAKAKHRANPEVACRIKAYSVHYDRVVRFERNPNRRTEVRDAGRRRRNIPAPCDFLTETERRRLVDASRYARDSAYSTQVLAKNAARKARKLKAVPAWADPAAIRDIYLAAQIASSACAAPRHVDHIVPLIHPLVCGLHCEANLRILPSRLNLQKSNRFWPDMPE